MPPPRWFMKSIVQIQISGGFTITIITNVACHLWLTWTDKVPWVHRTSVIERGLTVPWDFYWCFVAWTQIQQTEPGDTTTHTFTWLGWQTCQTKYFRFKGTIAGVESHSDTPIFHKHYVYVPPAWPYLEEWTWLGLPEPTYSLIIKEQWTS